MESQSNRGADPLARISIVDRLDALVRHPKRLLATIVALLVATGAAVGSSAVLTSSSTSPGNTFSASNLDVVNNNSAIISVSGMHPGDNASGDLTITNDGDLPAPAMTLSSAVVAHSEPKSGQIASVLTATITDTTNGGSTQVYSGPASPMTGTPPEPISLPGSGLAGVWTPGDARTYHIQLTFPSGSGNTFQLSTATLRYTWKASQQ